MTKIISLLPRLPDFPLMGKRVYLKDRYCIDGDSATEEITEGTFAEREAFVATLPDAICFEGKEGLMQAFRAWKEESKKSNKR